MRDSIEGRVGSAGVGAGLIDAAAAAAATFLASVYAVRVLTPENLGAHTLMFVAVILVTVVPERLVYVPTLAVSVDRGPATRLSSSCACRAIISIRADSDTVRVRPSKH